jgi:hypothetical protein
MRDDLGERLREEAVRFAASVTPRPAHLVRARGDQRRRRAAALSAAVAVAVLAGGGGGVYAAGHFGSARKVVPLNSSAPTPHPSPTGNTGSGTPIRQIFSVACISGTDCWAVGGSNLADPAGGRPLIEHWDGSRWSVGRDPVPSSALIGGLGDVSCFGARNCWATGDGSQFPLRAMHWNGSRWSLSAFAVPPQADTMRIRSVACTGAADCWAAGYADRGPITTPVTSATLIEHWNGTRWSVVPSPSMGRWSGLSAVSCAARADCWAIGTWLRPYSTPGGTLTEHWNGTAWSRVATSTDSSGYPTWIAGVLSSPQVNFGATMNDVSCVSGGACMAVGNGKYDGVPSLAAHQPGGSTALAQRWNGIAWADIGTPARTGANITDLLALSCTSASWCMAVGYFAPRNGAPHALTERWNGAAWAIVPTPSLPNWAGSTLTGVSCVTPADCWARGMSGNGSFLAHWNGSRWSMAR